jgi:hypothetical protein
MSTKFEQLLDLLVNEEMDKANELFHEIVVEKSRDIYENLIAEEEADEEMDESAEDDEMDESSEEEDESVDEGKDEEADESVDLEDSYSMEADDEGHDGFDNQDDDATGSLGQEVGADGEEGGHEGGEEGAIFDIKNAIAELEAAFAELEQAKGMGGDDDMGAEPAFGDEEGGEEQPEDEMMGMREGRRVTREYVEKVGNDWEKSGSMKTPGPVGSGSGDKAGQTSVSNTKSPVSSGKGKPTTGATAGNIAKSSTGEGAMDGTSPNAKVGGFLKAPQDIKSGNQNVPGGKVSVKGLTKVAQNSKTPGPVGSGTGDKAGQTSVGQAKSPLNGAPNRNA